MLLAALLRRLVTVARQRPVLAVLEDAHWADPTTCDLLDMLVERIAELSILLVVTHRPEFSPPWTGLAHVTSVTIRRLGRRESGALITYLSGGLALPQLVASQILGRADGVPLFVEELTKAVLDSELLHLSDGKYALHGPVPAKAIPSTLEALLSARLDRSPAAKHVAQVASAIGREFPFVLATAIAKLPGHQFQQALKELVEAGLISSRGTLPNTIYIFKHALIQEAAYNSMPRSRRQELHARIAGAITDLFPEQVKNAPELLAQHYASANQVEAAIRYWLAAGRRAFGQSANAEAVSHLASGIETLGRLPEGAVRASLELNLQATLGHVRVAASGYGHPDVERANARALELCNEISDPAQTTPVFFNLIAFHLGRGNLLTARSMCEQLIENAQSTGDLYTRLAAHTQLGVIEWHLGHNSASKANCETALAGYDQKQHGPLASVYGHDMGVISQSYLSLALWSLGFPGKAMQAAQQGLYLARSLSHPQSICVALGGGFNVLRLNGNPEICLRWAEDCIEIASEQKFPHWLAVATSHRGWAISKMGDINLGIEQLQQSIALLQETGAEIALPSYLAMLAEVYVLASRAEDALATVVHCLALVQKNAERQFEANALCARGDTFLALGEAYQDAAAQEYRKAVDIARVQNAKGWEIRAAVRLAHIWARQDKTRELCDLLLPLCAWFTEEYATADLRDAKALIGKHLRTVARK
jgi:predicted ATPase